MAYPAYMQRADELESALLPIIRLAGDGSVGARNMFAALYGLKGHLLPSYDFRTNGIYGKVDEDLRRDINLLCGEITSSIDRETRDQSFSLTANGRSSADMYLARLARDNAPALKILKNIATMVKNHLGDDSPAGLYKSVQNMRDYHFNIVERKPVY